MKLLRHDPIYNKKNAYFSLTATGAALNTIYEINYEVGTIPDTSYTP